MKSLAQIDSEKLEGYQELLIEYYTELYPTFNWSFGSFLFETCIRPQAIAFASQEQDLETLRNNFSLTAAASQTNPDEALVESLASNFRVTPRTGTNGTGELAVYTTQTSNIYIRAGSIFDAGGVRLTVDKTYIGVVAIAFQESTMDTEYLTMTAVGSEYVFIVPVRTLEPTAASVSEGQAVSMTNKPSQVARIEVSSAVSGGTVSETAKELAARAAAGVTARVPSGNRHLEALLAQEAGINIFSQASFGINDPECLRDRNNVFGISAGGRVDTYVRTAQLPATYTVLLNGTPHGNDVWEINIPAAIAGGFYFVEKITTAGSVKQITNQDELSVEYRYTDSGAAGPELWNAMTARFSSYQAATVVFSFPALDETRQQPFTLQLRALPNLKAVQTFVNRRDVRNEANDVLIKAPVPTFVGIDLNILRPSGSTDITTADITGVVAAAINALPMGRPALTASLVVQAVEEAYPELEVDFPVIFDSSTYMPDGTRYMQRECQGKLTPPEDLLQGVTYRNSVFFAQASEIEVTFQDIS